MLTTVPSRKTMPVPSTATASTHLPFAVARAIPATAASGRADWPVWPVWPSMLTRS